MGGTMEVVVMTVIVEMEAVAREGLERVGRGRWRCCAGWMWWQAGRGGQGTETQRENRTHTGRKKKAMALLLTSTIYSTCLPG